MSPTIEATTVLLSAVLAPWMQFLCYSAVYVDCGAAGSQWGILGGGEEAFWCRGRVGKLVGEWLREKAGPEKLHSSKSRASMKGV